MIAGPLNDDDCLLKVLARVRAAMVRSDVRDLAARLGSTRAVVRYIRRLPWRADLGVPTDEGPHVACEVPQRVRVPAVDPNCVERTALYLALAELLDPAPPRHLMTLETPEGLHTFPVENGAPVCLDPQAAPRNALAAGLHHVRNARGEIGVRLSPLDSLSWAVNLAHDVARETPSGSRRHALASHDVARIASGRLPVQPAALGWALRLAVPAALAFGPFGQVALLAAASLLDEIGGAPASSSATSRTPIAP